jgi:hypothetical protein
MSDDFGVGAEVLEFIITTTSGITSGVVASLLTAKLQALHPSKATTIQVVVLHVIHHEQERLRLRVELSDKNQEVSDADNSD